MNEELVAETSLVVQWWRQGTWFQSLVKELRSLLHNVAKNKKEEERKKQQQMSSKFRSNQ